MKEVREGPTYLDLLKEHPSAIIKSSTGVIQSDLTSSQYVPGLIGEELPALVENGTYLVPKWYGNVVLLDGKKFDSPRFNLSGELIVIEKNQAELLETGKAKEIFPRIREKYKDYD